MPLEKISLNQKLSFGVGGILMIVILLGAFSLNRMMKLSQLTVDMYEHPLTVSKALLKIESDINAMHRSMKDVAIAETNDSRAATIGLVTEYEQTVYKSLSIVSENFLGNSTSIQHTSELFSEWKPLRDEVIELSKSSSKQAAINITTGKGAAHVSQIKLSLEPMIEFAEQKADQFLQDSRKQRNSSIALMLLVIALFVVVAIIVFLLTIRILKASQDTLKGFMSSATDGFILLDSDLNYVDINDAALKIIGLKSESVIGKSMTEVSPDLIETGRYAAYQKVIETGKPFLVSDLILHSRLGEKHIELKAFKINEGFGIILSDITERKQTEKVVLAEKMFSESLVSSLPGVFYLISEAGKFLRWNSNFETVTGRSPEEIAQISPLELFEGEDKQVLGVAIQGVFTHGQDQAEGQLVAKDGKRTPYQFSGKKIVVDGAPCLIGLGLDITERKFSEYSLKESEEKFRALYDNAPLSYQALDEDGSFMDVNPMWSTTLGYDRDEIIGKFYIDYLHPDWKAQFEKDFPSFKKQGYIHEVEFKIKHKDGHYLDIQFEGCIGYNPDGSFKQIYCVFQDITLRKEAEAALQKSKEHYRQVVQDQTEFIIRYFPDGTRNFVNDSYCSAFNVSEKEALASNIFDSLPVEEVSRIKRKIASLSPENPVAIDEHSLKGDDGREIWHFWADRGIFDEKGELKEIQAVGRDITKRILA